MKGQKIRLIGSIASLFVTVLILVFTLYGWYVSNEQASVTGATGVTANDDSVRFMDDVLAVRHNLNGDIITNTYERDTDGKLVLKRSEIYTASTNTTEVITTFAEKTYFVVTEMLPGEYVDVTIGYSIDESKNGHNYKIYMKEIYGDDFVIDGKTHYVTGVFKYMSTGLKNASDTSISDFTPDTEYTWFNSYNIAQNDSPTLDKVIMNHTWSDDNDVLYYTFRVSEDFTQYYKLIAQAENSYGNLLSKRKFTIGEIYLFVE